MSQLREKLNLPKKVSGCCGAEETSQYNDDFPFCPICRDNTVFVNPEDFDDPFETDVDGMITKEYDENKRNTSEASS